MVIRCVIIMNKDAKIYVAGHTGLVGSAVVRQLEKQGFVNILKRSIQELDLTQQTQVDDFFAKEKPDYVFLAAAKVGGIHANVTFPAEFVYQNIIIQTNVIQAAYQYAVKRLLFLGSSCIYPRNCPQPIKEEYLLTGELEFTNRSYAVAKISGIEMCWAYNRQYDTRYLAVMPTNLYGPGDNYDLQNSHVLPALIRKFHEAKLNGDSQVEVWGTGVPKREFLHSDDLAAACVYLMNLSAKTFDEVLSSTSLPPVLNIGCGEDISIRELAELIQDIVGFSGDIFWNSEYPDGTPRKLLDITQMNRLGWKPVITLTKGIELAYQSYLDTLKTV